MPLAITNSDVSNLLMSRLARFEQPANMDLIDCTHNHAFRVAFNSRLIGLGFSSADRALILGHEVQTNEANYSVTDKRHLADLHKKLTGEVVHNGNRNTENSVVKEE